MAIVVHQLLELSKKIWIGDLGVAAGSQSGGSSCPGLPCLVLLYCPYLAAILEKPASEVLSRLVWQVWATPPLVPAGAQPSPAQNFARARGQQRFAAGRPPTRLALWLPLSDFLQRQQDIFPMFHEVLRRPFPPRVLPFLAAVLFQRKERKDTGFCHWRWEKHPYYNLTVKVLRARNIKGTDVLSKADCYVELKLPTASPSVSRTQVVDNSENPEWNETFQYRIHSAVKNILELTLYDKDVLVSDELTSVIFDVGGMRLGEPLLRTFSLDPEANEELDVEFFLEKCSDAPTEVLTNGVLVAHPCLCLQGTVNKEGNAKEKQQGCCEVKVSVPGAYQKQLSIPWTPDNEKDSGTSFIFHVDKEMCPELQVELQQTISVLQDGVNPDIEKHTTVLGLGTVPVNSLPIGEKVDRIISLGEGKSLDMSLKTEESSWDLDIRMGFDLCKEEREFLDKRKKVVSEALRKTLHLKESPPKDEVPVVAVLGSGGGMRALTSLYGSLAGLQQLGLLDAAMYLCGISGSTCIFRCLSTLYRDPDWSQKDLQDAISRAQDTVSSSKAGAFSPERLKYYFQELNAMEITGRKVSFTDLWGLIVEYFLQQEEDSSKLSDQQAAVKWAQNPYPIYAAVNVRPNMSSGDFAEWCEFTPYEVGFRKYGAFVRTENFDSEFFMGRLVQKHPEPRICFLQGMWGSAFAASLDDICLKVVGIGLSFLDSFKDVIKVVDDCRRFHFRDPARLKTRLVTPGGPLLQVFQDFFKSRVTCGETFNFMKGLYLHKDYVNIKKFVTWRVSYRYSPGCVSQPADSHGGELVFSGWWLFHQLSLSFGTSAREGCGCYLVIQFFLGSSI
ncbi:cytosolic phospholipase A2 zeta isoform X4 [Pyrgilauda ruficollis]|uniref:cytosolic phospholipase A2 zeta isoform X4 n=1 Tax=Pyrgilauda ruficollis TaxID=221976 RepID=UPI001B868BD6|nr:cytosolic phospholipase A2 zeta isoform X4 [Pyrgilauda ruficollis]